MKRRVAVDVGNSAVKLSLNEPRGSGVGQATVDHTVPLTRQGWERVVIDWVTTRLNGCQADWRIAAVHRSAARRLDRALAEASQQPPARHVTRHDVPMDLLVDDPDAVGIDRILGTHAAANRFAPPIVVVDAGSAVTVDWVDAEGRFCGGAILPGIFLQLAALATGTDALPQIDSHQQAASSLPGRNTIDAIRIGVTTGIAASIDRLAADYSSQAETEPDRVTMVISGGDAATLSRLVRRPHRVENYLVCRGLLDLP